MGNIQYQLCSIIAQSIQPIPKHVKQTRLRQIKMVGHCARQLTWTLKKKIKVIKGKNKRQNWGTSLVVQWLRLHLPMQGVQV